jgi:DNA-binding transcriptional ArsR family regulator
MPVKEKPGDATPDVLVIDDPRDIRLIFSEKHNMVLKLVVEKEMSISDIARALGINPGSAHYYLKELEKHGLVKQVRSEIKGGVVKKYYRAAARRILMDTPDFNRPGSAMPDGDITEHLLRSVEYLGYHVQPENVEDAKDLLKRYDHRVKELLFDLGNTGLANVEDNAITLQNAYYLIMSIYSKSDPEMARIYSEFDKLFLRCE